MRGSDSAGNTDIAPLCERHSINTLLSAHRILVSTNHLLPTGATHKGS